MTDFKGEVISNESIKKERQIINSLSTSKDHAVNFKDHENFHKALNDKFNEAKVGASKGRHGVILESLFQK